MSCDLCNETGGIVLWRDAFCRVILVEERGYPGFCRVILNAHASEMTDLAYDERVRLMQVVFAAEDAVREIMHPHKINLASLGNMAPHLHWHVIPRYPDDPHFPQPIWGRKQRDSTRAPPAGLEAKLAAALAEKLP